MVEDMDYLHLAQPDRSTQSDAGIPCYQYSPFLQCYADQLVVTALPGKQRVVSHHPEPLGQPAHIDINYETTVGRHRSPASGASVYNATTIPS